MNARTRTLVVLLGLFALLAAGHPSGVLAQSQSARPLFLALPDRFPDIDARVVIMREPGRDLVILREGDAIPEALDSALGVLARMDRDHPRPADRGQLIPLTGFVYPNGLAPERRAELAAVIQQLRERPLANVGNLGSGHWIRYEAE